MLPRISRPRFVVPLLASAALVLGGMVPTASAALADVSPSPIAYGTGTSLASAVYPQVDGAPSAWQAGLTGRGVGVAVIDTGINNTGDLAGKVIDGFDFTGEGDYTKDSYGHGTFVAGTIAGSGAASGGAIRGVAPGVNLVSLKVAGASGKTNLVRVIFAIEWAIAHAKADNIRVLNLSFGRLTNEAWTLTPLNAAVEAAWRAGLVVVVSAGNNGANGIAQPADDPYVVTVGATDDATTVARGDDSVAPFSSTGPTVGGLAKPDLVAPGAHLVSTRSPGSKIDLAHPESRVLGSYFRGSGTSFAAPQVAGAAALLLQQRPQLDNDHVKAMLTQSATPLPGVARSAQGAGALNIATLLTTPAGQPANVGLTPTSGSAMLQSPGALLRGLLKYAFPWGAYSWPTYSWDTYSWDTYSWDTYSWDTYSWDTYSWDTYSWDTYSWDTYSWDDYDWN